MKFMKIKLLVIALIMFAASSAFASLSYDVSVDTSSLSGLGYIYMQYNTAVNQVGTTTAYVQNFATDGTLGSTVASTLPGVNSSNVSGVLPATVSFTNGIVQTVDYNQAITFGNSFHFSLLLPNSTASNAGSNFTLWLAADAAGTPLKTDDGLLLTIGLNADGTATALIADAGTTATPTPIPAAAWLLGSGLMGLVGLRRRKE